ncbi:MAG: DUF721 domain-containing protein [Bacteroidota bacterium]
MKYSNDQSLGSAIEQFLKAYRLDDKVNERKLIHSWEAVVGKMIAGHTRDLSIRNKILFVRIDSSALKNELIYQKERLINSLNETAGVKVIIDIVFN